MKEPIKIFPKQKKVRLILLSTVPLIIGGGLIGYYLNGWVLAIPLLGAGILNFYFSFKKVFLKEPILIIDENGITDQMNFPSLGFIPWGIIERADIKKIMNFDSLCLYMKNPEEEIAKVSAIKRFFLKSNQQNLGTYAFFRTNVMPESSEKMLMAVNHFIEQNK